MMVSSKEEIKVIAIGSEKRMNQLADVPTFKEFGMDFYPRIARGVMVPKAVPKDILKRKEV